MACGTTNWFRTSKQGSLGAFQKAAAAVRVGGGLNIQAPPSPRHTPPLCHKLWRLEQ